MRGHGHKHADCVRLAKIKTKEEEELANEEGADQGQEALGWLTLPGQGELEGGRKWLTGLS